MSINFSPEQKDVDLPPWKILIIDDEEDIHTVTKMALRRFEMDGRGLSFLHAYSGVEGRELLKKEQDIALVLLDVVMETDDAGLQLAKWMRQELGNVFSRIILRTGQPGQAPEEKVIVDYDINDYKEKTELDRKKLFTTVYAGLRAYRDIIRVDEARRYEELYRNGLERVIRSTSHVFELRTLKQFFDGLLQQIMSLLRLNEQSMLVQIKGVGAVLNNDNLEIVASMGLDDVNQKIDSTVLDYLTRAKTAKFSILEDDVFVGYYPSKSGQVSLLYLKGVENVNPVDMKLLEVFSGNVSLAFDNLLLNSEIINTQEELIYRLGDVVESRSNEAGNHVRRMSEVCKMLALTIGMSAEDAELLRQASPMHDIGKIATPDAILLKPGKLEVDEMAVMKEHPDIGFNILQGSSRPMLKAAAIISQQHHEKYDGTGYPQGLVGEDIHPFARIVAVADVFDALTHKRCYKDAWPIEKVKSFMAQVSGSHLDPVVVTALLNNIDKAVEINRKHTDEM